MIPESLSVRRHQQGVRACAAQRGVGVGKGGIGPHRWERFDHEFSHGRVVEHQEALLTDPAAQYGFVGQGAYDLPRVDHWELRDAAFAHGVHELAHALVGPGHDDIGRHAVGDAIGEARTEGANGGDRLLGLSYADAHGDAALVLDSVSPIAEAVCGVRVGLADRAG